MSKILRTLAAAAALAVGLPQMASAALVTKTLDFDIGIGAPDTALTTQYNDDAHGKTVFSGANGFFGDFSVGHPGLGAGHTGVLLNGCLANCGGSLITLTVNSLFQGTLDFWVWTRASVGQLNVFVAPGEDTRKNVTGFTLPLIDNGQNNPASWQHITIGLAANTLYSTIQFQILDGRAYVDDISFQTEAATNNVPEPASMALVALGLVGAATATRRRKG